MATIVSQRIEHTISKGIIRPSYTRARISASIYTKASVIIMHSVSIITAVYCMSEFINDEIYEKINKSLFYLDCTLI